jgi:hypothetical protein
MSKKVLTYFSLSVILFISGCSSSKHDEQSEWRNKIKEQYIQNGRIVYKTLSDKQKEILRRCVNEADGVPVGDFYDYNQSDVDKLIQLRLIVLKKEIRKYQATMYGQDMIKTNSL